MLLILFYSVKQKGRKQSMWYIRGWGEALRGPKQVDLCLHYAPQGLPQLELSHGPFNDMHVCLMNAEQGWGRLLKEAVHLTVLPTSNHNGHALLQSELEDYLYCDFLPSIQSRL